MSEVTVFGEALGGGWFRHQQEKRTDCVEVIYTLVDGSKTMLRVTASREGLRVWSDGGGTRFENNEAIELLNYMLTVAHRQYDDRLYRDLKPFTHAEDAELLFWLLAHAGSTE